MKKYVAMLLTVVIMSAPCAYAGDSVVSKSNQSILTINHVQYQYIISTAEMMELKLKLQI